MVSELGPGNLCCLEPTSPLIQGKHEVGKQFLQFEEISHIGEMQSDILLPLF